MHIVTTDKLYSKYGNNMLATKIYFLRFINQIKDYSLQDLDQRNKNISVLARPGNFAPDMHTYDTY